MKQWLAILAFLWVTATAQSTGECHPQSCRAELRAAILTQDNGDTVNPETIPLLATATLPGSTHLCGAAQDGGKGGRSTEYFHATTARILTGVFHSHATNTDVLTYDSCPPNTRATERYIYFLRRIII